MESHFAFKIPKKAGNEANSGSVKPPTVNIFSKSQANPFKFVASKDSTANVSSKEPSANPFTSGSKPSFHIQPKPPSLLQDGSKEPKKSIFESSMSRSFGEKSEGKSSIFGNKFKLDRSQSPKRDDAPATRPSIPSLMQQRLASNFDRTEQRRPASPFGDASPERPVRRPAFERLEKLTRSEQQENPFQMSRQPGPPVFQPHERTFAPKIRPLPETKPFNKTKLLPSGMITREISSILQSLSDLRNRHCPDDYSRYMVLDERDKLLYKLRAEKEKNTPPVGKKVVTGTLNSMCAEKERYVRSVQKRISGFECDEAGEIDSNKLIKEYARSAADQEKPLPHELRKPEMLRYSMNYLLTNILDFVPESEELAGWYNFLWDRTRAIRKEVTQLMMTNELAVSLLESCTRFHIVCAYLLCSQDLEKFDQKMNTENLGKSLQTLRHLYEDLAKRDIFLDSEPEFRSYDVLLHLHDSNVLRQVLSYRKSVREAPPVRLAIQLASAMQTNNFTRFFRLLRDRATYLQCCICHRFIAQVRSKALGVMAKSYGRNPSFSIQYMSNVLAFDDEQNALSILGEYGVYLNDMNSEEVDFTREHLNTDAEPQMVTYKWIDRKSACPLSQTVNGALVEETGEILETSDSFDARGFYRQDPILQHVLEEFSQFKPEPTPALSTFETPKPDAPFAPIPSIPPVMAVDLVAQKRAEEEKARQLENERFRKLEEERLRQEQNRKAAEEQRKKQLEEQRRAEEELQIRLAAERKEQRKKDEAKQQIDRIVPQIYEHIEILITQKELRRIIVEEVKRAQDERGVALEKTHKVTEQFISSTVDTQLKKIIASVLKGRRKEIEEGLSYHRERLSLLWLRQFWDQWRNQVTARKEGRRRRSLAWDDFTPNWVSATFAPERYISSPGSQSTAKDETHLTTRQRLGLANIRRRRILRISRDVFDWWRFYAQQTTLARKQAEIIVAQSKRSFSLRRPHASEGLNVDEIRKASSFRDDSPVRKSAKLTLEESFRFPTVPKNNDRYEDDLNDSFVPAALEDSVLTEDDLAFARKELERTSIAMPTRTSNSERKASSSMPEEVTDALDETRLETVELLDECRQGQQRSKDLKQRAADLAETLRDHQTMVNSLLEEVIRKRTLN